jgi:hypothetical protein
MDSVGLLDNIYCNLHGKKSISVNSISYQLFCKSCVVLNSDDNGTKNLKVFNSDSDISVINCYKHHSEEAIFFCDDCSEFICKNCFATDHRQHSSSTPELMVKIIKDNLISNVTQLNQLKKNVEDCIQSMQELNNYFNNNKNNFKNFMKDVNDKISKNLEAKSKEFTEEIENIFNGIDFEVENSTQRLENNKKKANKMINEFQSMLKEVESIKSDKKVCLFKQEKDSYISQNKKFLSDLNFFLKENLEKTKDKSRKEMENFSKKCNKFQRNTSIYENSVINTISSGIPNICMRIRRFKNYFPANTTMFKTDSVCMLTSHTINLVGFSLCGLFDINSVDRLNKTENSDTKNFNNLKSLKLNIKIFELDSFEKYEVNSSPISNIIIELPVICNITDPVFQFYLNNSVTINKDKIYYIVINNLSQNFYIDIWKGKVSSETDLTQHSVICNNSCVKFNFLTAFGLESDINEFSGGIISDVIFSHVE